MLSYNPDCLFKDKNGFVYSCDNIRLTALLADDEECVEAFRKFFDNPMNLRVSDVITRHAQGKFRYMWNVSCDKTSYTVLYWFNGYDNNPDYKRKVIIDFNPNKLNYDERQEITNLLRNLVEVDIARFDLAVDVPVPRKFVHLIKDNRTYEFQDHNENGITEYLGTRNNINYVKVYDKTRESSLDEAMTRVELTCAPRLSESIKHFPSVLIEHEQISLEMLEYDNLSKTQIALVSLLKSLDVKSRVNALKTLNYRMKSKLSPYVLTDTYELVFDMTCVSKVYAWLSTCIKYKTFVVNSQT